MQVGVWEVCVWKLVVCRGQLAVTIAGRVAGLLVLLSVLCQVLAVVLLVMI